MTVLVTGAGGFIGSHLVEALLDRGYAVRALARYNGRGNWGHLEQVAAGLDAERRGRLEVRLGDVTDPFFVADLVRGCELVFHLAALIAIPYSYEAPASYVSANVTGTVNVLEAARRSGVKRVLITSTSEVYGTALYTPIDEKHPLQGQSPYSASKIGADKLAESYARSFGLAVTTVRPFNTYGPRQSARAVIPTIASQIAAGFAEVRLGSLWPERDLTYVADTAAGFVALAECEAAVGEVVNLGTGKKISVGELAREMIRLSGREIAIREMEERTRPADSEVGLLLADTTKVRRMTGWEPKVPFEQGLGATMDYVARNLHLYRPAEYQR